MDGSSTAAIDRTATGSGGKTAGVEKSTPAAASTAERETDGFDDLCPGTVLSDIVAVDHLGLDDFDLTVGDVRDAVYRASTLYQAPRRLGLDCETTTRLLRAFDLLDLVTGRLSTRRDREVPRNEITARVRAASEGEPGGA